MRYKKIESAIIKISIIVACLIIGAGTAQRVLGTKAEPVAKPKAAAQQTPTSTTQTSNGNKATESAAKPETIPKGKIVAIGDSFTYGGLYGIDLAWANIVSRDLNREVVNRGKSTGQSSKDVLARFTNDVINASPKVVIIQVGTRDAMTGVSLDEYQKNIQDMVKAAKDKEIMPVLCLPLPYPDKNANNLITAYRGWLMSFAQEQGIWVIDFNPDLTDNGSTRKEFSDDGKSLNKKGFEAMANTVEKILGN